MNAAPRPGSGAPAVRDVGARGFPERPRYNAHEARQASRLATVTGLVAAFFGLELVGALLSGSVVLQADALHLFTDVLALGFSLLAMRLAVRRATPRFTYGWRRAEPVAALISAVLVLLTTTLIVAEGIDALHARTPPKAGLMLVFAVLAIVVNGISAWLLHDVVGHRPGGARGRGDREAPRDHDLDDDRGRGHALNLRVASLHLFGDALGAVAALLAALVIRLGGPSAADPIAGFVVAGILLTSAVRLFGQASLVLFEAAPAHMPVAKVRALVEGFPEVAGIHELHVWSLGGGHDAVTVHVLAAAPDGSLGARLSARLRRALGAEYVTVQVEAVLGPGPPCEDADPP